MTIVAMRHHCAMTFLPLGGMTVVDMTSSLAGPYCTEILGALGADVVKIEHPQRGDDARGWGPPFWNGESTMFLAANASKRSLGLDLKSLRGREALLRLVDRADVFVQSLRAGLAESYGFGPDELRARNPRLVYCALRAFGRSGPLADRPGYDPLMQAFAGIVSITGEPDRPGVRAGVSVVDQGTGMWAALGIVAALLERERTGEGRVVDVSLLETAVGWLAPQLTGYFATGTPPGRVGTRYPSIVPYQVFAAADGELMVAAANDRLFAALCTALELPGLAEDARFTRNADRVANREELVPVIAERIAREPLADVLARLDRAGVPAAPVQDVAQAAAHEQVRALGILQELPHPDVPELLVASLPLAFDGERVRHRSPAPRLGADSLAVLAELGYSPEEIEELAAEGVVTDSSVPST
jgi:crotonobetainyl-CoA:carnitine CoA-transferase CaiB-like acyl-CoA transferase